MSSFSSLHACCSYVLSLYIYLYINCALLEQKRFLWDEDMESSAAIRNAGPTQRGVAARFGPSTRQLGALAPIDLTPEQRQRNVIDPRALPSALAAQGGYFNSSDNSGWGGGGSGYLRDYRDENHGPGIAQRIGTAIDSVGSAVGDALSSLTTTTKTKAAGFTWPGQGGGPNHNNSKSQKSSYSDYDVDARISNLKNLNQTINLHTIQTEAEIYATEPNRGGGFPGQLMLSTAASSMGRAVSSATDTPSKRRRLCLVIVASAAIITALAVGTSTDVASDIANRLPTLPTLGGGSSGGGGSLKDLQRTESNPRFSSIRTRILHAGVSDPAVLSTPTEWPPSPQYQAVQWLAEGDARQVHPDDEYILQRYALATFWISTYGRVMEESELVHSHHYGSRRSLADEEEDKMWLRRKNWMTKHGICSWEGVQCHHRPGGTHDETHYDEVSCELHLSTSIELDGCSFSHKRLLYPTILSFRTTTSPSCTLPTMVFEDLFHRSCSRP